MLRKGVDNVARNDIIPFLKKKVIFEHRHYMLRSWYSIPDAKQRKLTAPKRLLQKPKSCHDSGPNTVATGFDTVLLPQPLKKPPAGAAAAAAAGLSVSRAGLAAVVTMHASLALGR